MTESGREVLPERFQPLLVPGSPLREALEWRGRSAGLDVPSILRALQEQAPGELVSFTRDGSRKRWVHPLGGLRYAHAGTGNAGFFLPPPRR